VRYHRERDGDLREKVHTRIYWRLRFSDGPLGSFAALAAGILSAFKVRSGIPSFLKVSNGARLQAIRSANSVGQMRNSYTIRGHLLFLSWFSHLLGP
jgi:hypothetical protein